MIRWYYNDRSSSQEPFFYQFLHFFLNNQYRKLLIKFSRKKYTTWESWLLYLGRSCWKTSVEKYLQALEENGSGKKAMLMFKKYMKIMRSVSMDRAKGPSAVACACAYHIRKSLRVCLNRVLRYKPDFKAESRPMVLAHVEMFVGQEGLPLLYESWFQTETCTVHSLTQNFFPGQSSHQKL